MSEPTINDQAGTITYDFNSSTGYTLVNGRITAAFGEGSFILTPQSYTTYENCEPGFDAGWRFTDSLAISTLHDYIDSNNILFDNPSIGDKNSLGSLAVNPSTGTRIFSCFFYDGDVGDNEEIAFSLQSSLTSPSAFGVLDFGWEDTTVVGKYAYKTLADDDVWKDTGVSRSRDWHKVIMITTSNVLEATTFIRNRIYIDSNQVYNLQVTDGSLGANWRVFWTLMLNPRAGQNHNIDEIILSRANNVYSVGTCETPKAQPSAVKEWSGFSVSEDTTGAWAGTTLYEFQHSTDGGSTYNGTWLALTSDNLQGVVCDGDGQDAIKVRITHTPDSVIVNSTSIPRTKQVTINFLGYRYPLEYFKQD